MSKITNDGLTRSGTWCFIPVPIRQQWCQRVNFSRRWRDTDKSVTNANGF